jgi:general secretion pathway protein G
MLHPRPAFPNRRTRERGFTLLELMVVVAILGLLIALVAPAAMGRLGKAKRDIAAQSIARTGPILELYKLDIGSYPTTDQGLDALVEKPTDASNWSGPYIQNKKVPLDPWGKPFVYRSPSTRGDHEYDLCTYGAHGAPGGTGDDATICND